jgi:hypothetical protein
MVVMPVPPPSQGGMGWVFLFKLLSQCLAKHVVHLVVAELLLEVADGGLLVDLDVLDAYDLCEIFPVLLVDVV